MAFNMSQASGAFLGVVALGLTAFLGGAAERPAPGKFAVIDAGRINLREPDGTLRLVISNAAQAPGIIVRGHEQPHPSRHSAGMIFFNDEGTENGGLIFDGHAGPDGERHSSGSLTFDRYEQDQVVQVTGSEDGHTRSAGVIVNDQPEQIMDFPAIERARGLSGAAQQAAFRKAHVGGTQRAFLGRTESGDAAIILRDAQGTKRLVLRVGPDGASRIDFLDQAGRIVRSVDALHS